MFTVSCNNRSIHFCVIQNDRKHAIGYTTLRLRTGLKSCSGLKFKQWYKTVKISGHTEKSQDNTSHCRFIGIIMAQIRILLLCVLSLKIIGLHASSSTHTSDHTFELCMECQKE